MLQLSMKCWNLAYNAQGWGLIIVVVQVRGVKIYVAAVEALRKKEREDETQFTTKIDGSLSFNPPWMLMYFFLNLTLCMTKLRVLVLCLSYFTDNSIAWNLLWGLIIKVQYPIVHHKIKVFMLLKKGPLLFRIAQN